MSTQALTLQIDTEVVAAFKSAPVEEQEKLTLLVNALLRESAKSDVSSLKQVMDDIGQKAQGRGLTPEILDSILGEG